LEKDDLVWATNENPAFAEKAEANMFNKYTKEAGFTQKYKSNGFRMITLYSFRSFFFGRASDVKREGYAHRMIGHGGYLPQYDRMSDDKKIEWFLEVEPYLTINEEERQKLVIKELQNEKIDLEKVKKEWMKELQTKNEMFATELRKNILQELTDPNGINSIEQLKDITARYKQLRKDVGLE